MPEQDGDPGQADAFLFSSEACVKGIWFWGCRLATAFGFAGIFKSCFSLGIVKSDKEDFVMALLFSNEENCTSAGSALFRSRESMLSAFLSRSAVASALA